MSGMSLFEWGILLMVMSFAVSLGAATLVLADQEKTEYRAWLQNKKDSDSFFSGFPLNYVIGVSTRIIFLLGICLVISSLFI